MESALGLKLNSLTRKQLVTDRITLDYDELDVGGRTVRYVATASHSVKRSRSLLTKEPLTVPWIETFSEGDVYVDVGANVGMYAIYAGVRGAEVYAFEPESQNYAELNKNIFVNDLHGRVKAYCMAISDEVDVSVLYLSGFGPAYAHNDFGQNRWTEGKTMGVVAENPEARLQQGSVAFPIDELVAKGKIKAPNHLKIDVDGFEYKVVAGALNTLQSADLQTVLLEVDFALPDSVALIDRMTDMGWRYSQDQVRLNQHAIMTFEKIESLKRRGKGGANYIFYRDEDRYGPFFSRFIENFVPPNPLT